MRTGSVWAMGAKRRILASGMTRDVLLPYQEDGQQNVIFTRDANFCSTGKYVYDILGRPSQRETTNFLASQPHGAELAPTPHPLVSVRNILSYRDNDWFVEDPEDPQPTGPSIPPLLRLCSQTIPATAIDTAGLYRLCPRVGPLERSRPRRKTDIRNGEKIPNQLGGIPAQQRFQLKACLVLKWCPSQEETLSLLAEAELPDTNTDGQLLDFSSWDSTHRL